MITSYPYTGPNETKVPIARIQHLKRSETFMQKSNFVLHFADKQCQNENVVGGKGHSLATLTSITTSDVCIFDGGFDLRNLMMMIIRLISSSVTVCGTSRLLRNKLRSGMATAA